MTNNNERILTSFEEYIIVDWLPENLKKDDQMRSYVTTEDIRKLDLKSDKLEILMKLLKNYEINVRLLSNREEHEQDAVGVEDRSPRVKDYDMGQVPDVKRDIPTYSTVEYSDSQEIIKTNYDWLDKKLTEFLKNNIKFIKKKDRETEDIDIYASVQLNSLLSLKLNEEELKHAFEFLDSKDIVVRGINASLQSEVKDYMFVRNYHSLGDHTKLPVPLDWDEQESLFEEYSRTKDPNIKRRLIETNLKLIPWVTYKLSIRYGFNQDELNGYGYEGLVNAIEKFDLSKGYKISTYAYKSILNSVLRRKANELGFYNFKQYLDVLEAIDTVTNYYEENGIEFKAAKSEIIELLTVTKGYSEKLARLALSRFNLGTYDSLDEIQEEIQAAEDLNDEEYDSENSEYNGPLKKTLRFAEELTYDNISHDDELDKKQLKEIFAEVFKTLTPREELVIKMRFGLDDGVAKTLEEVGATLNVNRERVRQIEAKALLKLRHPSRSEKIKDYLESPASSGIHRKI